MRAICLDVETTGPDPSTDRVVEIAVIDLNDEDFTFHSLVNPQIPISAEAVEVHGITNAHVATAPRFMDIAEDVRAIINDAAVVTGYHVNFDQQVIDFEYDRLNSHVHWPTVVCALRLWNVYEPKPSRNLQNAYKRFVREAGFDNAHSALADVRATREVILSQIQEFGLANKEWEDLDPEAMLWWGPTHHIAVAEDGTYLRMNFGKHEGHNVLDIPRGYWSWIQGADFPSHVKRLGEFIRMDYHVTDDTVMKFARELYAC